VLPYADGASFRRGSLLAVLEHGLPVITTMPEADREASRESSGQQEWPELADGENAMLVLSGDAEGLASAIEKVAADAGLRARLAEGAAKVAQFFSWARIAGAHATLYRRLT
jgi:glycosyltransferase involved in cell wall biosynthesis